MRLGLVFGSMCLCQCPWLSLFAWYYFISLDSLEAIFFSLPSFCGLSFLMPLIFFSLFSAKVWYSLKRKKNLNFFVFDNFLMVKIIFCTVNFSVLEVAILTINR